MNKDEQYLLDNGWTRQEVKWGDGKITYSYDIENRFSRGGLSLNYAMKVQKQYEIINKIGAFYCSIRDGYGFGYKIKFYTDKNKENWKMTEFTHLSKETADLLVANFNSGLMSKCAEDYRQKFNLIVVFKESHCNRYFIVACFEDLCKVAIKVFKERDDEKYWYDYSGLEKLQPPDISKEEISKMKSESAKAVLLKEWKDYELKLDRNKELSEEKSLYDKAKNDKVGNIALRFLELRKESEYENFEVIEGEEY